MAKSAASVMGLALVLLLASASLIDAAAPAYDKPPPGTNCNRSCWKAPNLFALKNTIFQLCGVYNTVQIIQSNETKRTGQRPQDGSGRSGPPAYGVCQTFIYYRFKDYNSLNNFQTCQSKQTIYVNQVVNKGYKQILVAPPKYSRC